MQTELLQGITGILSGAADLIGTHPRYNVDDDRVAIWLNMAHAAVADALGSIQEALDVEAEEAGL